MNRTGLLYDILALSSAKRGGIATMTVLSFVALELQTTHLDPASVSQASYVKLVNGNITLVDSWPVIPPTTAGDASKEPPRQTKTWGQALSQLTMMVGTLPVVSYYRDADKEVFQAASQHSGETPPEFRWLDCRELAKKYLPDLPEFQLSTVLQALDLFDEYSDSNSVEQTSQIVIELARRHNVSSVKELWGELYDQPDKLLGLDAGLEGLNFAAVPPAVHEEPTEEVADAPVPAEDTVNNDPADPVETEHQPEPVEAEERLDETEVSREERIEDPAPQSEPALVPAEDTEIPEAAPNSEVAEPTNKHEDEATPKPDHDGVPAVTPAAMPIQTQPEAESTESPGSPEDSGPTADAAPAEELEEERSSEPSPAEAEIQRQLLTDEPSDENAEGSTDEPLQPAEPEKEIAPAEPAVTQRRTDERTDIPTFEVGEVAEHSTTEPQQPETESEQPKKSSAIRTLGFFGVFVFGLLTVVGVVLTVMATMLFFTDNSLMLETKIAGVILTGAISILSLLMTAFSFKSFRDN